MNMKKQKSLAARALRVGKNRVRINTARIETIKEAITRSDLRSVRGTSIIVKKKKGTSRARVRKIIEQKKKGRRKGPGSKKGGKYSRLSRKESWMARVRVQRKFLRLLKSKNKIDLKSYRKLYKMVKGGFFRSKAHLKLYISKMEK